ncbi:hypothetical protein SAMD00019534_011190 [Acytostelium subglobosum LB1]|uniref:hypothetical protein n=1 Tax=Acytostelium subglobosum LB1 TaxID=1410327 RepID=UPI000644FE2B|nr:hypothetical protein SAMD00019534_011190 [Acytostelium subglobosum LB1]GAM17944.1 hypothetical protein SAMD00019534_011190 [Acytostelium subglobosum LB1]|eukprot:XP_012758540.1 hypothetical protein SAMD00019534_011190 [Acytostelium subglobosum LB1]
MDIKLATKEDIPGVYKLLMELAEFEQLAHAVVGNEQDIEKWAFGNDKVITVYCGWYEGRMIGYTLHYTTFSTFQCRPGLYIEDIYVQPEYRGKGFGKQLLLHVCKLANDKGYGRVEWQVLRWLKPSIAFYESLGAQPLNDWTQYRLIGEPLEHHANAYSRID